MRNAFDIGSVLGPKLKERLGDDGLYKLVDPYPYAIEFVSACAEKWGAENQFIISRVEKSDQIQINRRLLDHWQFQKRTGIPDDNIIIYFGDRSCKRDCVKKRCINRIFDDHPEILAQMDENVDVVAVGPQDDEFALYKKTLEQRNNFYRVPRDWRYIAQLFNIPLPITRAY